MEAATRRAEEWLASLGAALDGGNYAGAADLFVEDSYWRDLVSFTWNIVTIEGRDDIRAMLEARADDTAPTNWRVEGEATEADGVTEAWFAFETAVSRGRGHLRLQGDLGWTILTTMDELKGFEEKTSEHRVRGVEHGVVRGRKSWLEQLEEERATLGYEQQPEVLIVGGGQGGIALGARLRRLDVPTIILERNERAGDSWRNRYKSLCLHDPVWYDHLPYLPFPDDWPVFAPKDKIADWLEAYTKIMELNYWTRSVATTASYDDDAGEWTVHVDRDGESVTLRPKQLVLATGMSGLPNVPDFPGADTFEGEIHHSSQHRDSARYAGKHCVVVGSNNSAHDICAALWEHGADVTMIQRTSTHIARSDTLMELALGDLYSERAVASGITTNTADMIFASIPYKIMHTFQIPVYEEMQRQDADFYQGLEDAGFMLDFGEDGSGLFMKYLRRASGYYIDVGASQLIIDGDVKLESDTTIERINERSVTLTNGKELPADLIVLATGYGSMNGFAAKIISQEVADKVGKVWGLGSGTAKDPGPWEGEERNMWKPTKQEGLWFHGGNLHQSRHYSQFLALQLKARYEGLSTPVYGMGDVHHLS
jgi:putative flavoprotein involved in K+ transport